MCGEGSGFIQTDDTLTCADDIESKRQDVKVLDSYSDSMYHWVVTWLDFRKDLQDPRR